MGLGDGFATAHDLPLRDRVDGIDVIKTLALRGIALVHGVDPHEARLPRRLGLAALADIHWGGAGLGVMDALFSIRPAAPQVVPSKKTIRKQPLFWSPFGGGCEVQSTGARGASINKPGRKRRGRAVD